jgi:imidazolonepropionase-like amidohydrolase
MRIKTFSRSFSLVAFGFALFALLAVRVYAETVLFQDAIVHTVSGATLSPGSVLVKDGKIVAVQREIAARVDRVENLKGLHLFPGLILPTSSLGLIEIAGVRSTLDVAEVGGFTPEVEAWQAVNPDSELLPVTRANGITHALVQPMGGVISGLSGVVTLSGWTPEQMTIKRPAALHIFWPHLALDASPKESSHDKSKWKSPEEQAKERVKKLKELDDFIADARAYAKARAAATGDKAKAFAIVPGWEAMLPVLDGKIPVMVHAEDARQIKSAMRWAETNQFKLILAGCLDAWRVADEIAKRKVPVIFEHVFTQPTRDTDGYDAQFRAATALHKAGVLLAFSEGPDAWNATRARNLPYAAAQSVAFGLPEVEALRAITLNPARILGVADRLGAIEAGKDATFFAANGNILDLRTQVKRVWIEGKETSVESRHTRLYEKYKNRPKPQ